ncbi:MAG: MMPL family transporter, partial [Thermoplasmataceae archaeon]
IRYAVLNSTLPENPLTHYALNYVPFLQYTNSTFLSKASSYYITNLTGFPVSWNLVYSDVNFQNPGNGYVLHFALLGAPGFLINQTVSPNHNIFIYLVEFSTPSGFQFKNGSSPSQEFYPELNAIAESVFGNGAIVTGNGAIAYQTAQLTAKSGFAFGLLFIFLLIAIFVTLVSYWASVLGLIFVGASLLLGYVSIFITGLITGNVSFIVNYTLTAVILGVSTDYLVFLISRYRQEIRSGKSFEESLEIAVNKAAKAVVISGVTVAVTLLTFSLIPAFLDWGLVLFQAIIYTVLLETTLLPVAMKFLSKRLIMKIGRKPINDDSVKRSVFYRTTSFTTRRKFAVAATIIILGSAGGYFFFTVPTSYDFNSGLPQSLSSVKGFNELVDNFGYGVIFPTYVIYKSGFSGGNLTNSQINALKDAADRILSFSGVKSVEGPFVSGSNLTNLSDPSSFAIDNGKYYFFIVSLDYSPYSSKAIQTVSQMRANASFIVGGLTSSIIDQRNSNTKIYSELEIFIVVAIFLILLAFFRKIRYPLISITGTFFSISWSTFILYLISKYLLHDQLLYLIPIILFIILFSLGNDYTVFIISRIIEETRGRAYEEGLRRGMAGSANVVTALGLILAVSLGSLSFIPVAFLEELGLAFVISLIIDTFIIRTFYFPSMLSIFHRREGGT